ncbi:hypothetical protein BCT54_12710 [Vibrio splendidus]|uniref:Uncharacterized protein n=1 Tax=Vibrio splendidus TaxID=29497 RepID=A0A2N7JJ30_VIBSP|nr:hypothetical protein BCT54_12710 [Vibrio splendidus]
MRVKYRVSREAFVWHLSVFNNFVTHSAALDAGKACAASESGGERLEGLLLESKLSTAVLFQDGLAFGITLLSLVKEQKSASKLVYCMRCMG